MRALLLLVLLAVPVWAEEPNPSLILSTDLTARLSGPAWESLRAPNDQHYYEPAPPPEDKALVEMKRIAKQVILDGGAIIGSHAVDSYFTAVAVERRVNGVAVAEEANYFGQTVERRGALKVLASVVEWGICTWLRLDNHQRTATIIRYAVVAFNLGLAVNNAVHAYK